MDKNKYKDLVEKYTPKENRLFNGLLAFFIGGLMGVLGQLLLDFYSYILEIPTKQASVFMIITLIFISCFFTCLGFFDKLVNLNIAVIMGTGAILLGLGNIMSKNNVNGINNKISKLILISYPSFIIVNILMLLIGTEIHVANDLGHNMRFNELFGEWIKSLGLFITFYFISAITLIFRKMYLKDN